MILQVVGSICTRISNDPPRGGLKRRSGLKNAAVGLGIAQMQETVDGQIPLNQLAFKNLVQVTSRKLQISKKNTILEP